MADNKKVLHKVTFTADINKRKIKVAFSPKLDTDNTGKLIQAHFNTVISGFCISLARLMADMPVLRPATQEERDLNVYVFKDGERENKLFLARKQIYDDLSNTFTSLLSEIFPDVEYVEHTRKYQQDFAFDKSPEEVEEYKMQIEKLVNKIREVNKYDA